uniref:Uncharacterized protein n=1 Tax=Anguilla anguilla TaxID=7936 RepID=A0A0E9UPA3_ANGAN
MCQCCVFTLIANPVRFGCIPTRNGPPRPHISLESHCADSLFVGFIFRSDRIFRLGGGAEGNRSGKHNEGS